MCLSGVTCLPTHLFSLLDTNNFISEGGGGVGILLCLSVENQMFFHTSGISKICLYIHEVKDTCIRDLKKISVCLGLPVTL